MIIVENRYKLKKIKKKPITCSVCLKVGKKSLIKKLLARKPLYKLSLNITKRPYDSKD